MIAALTPLLTSLGPLALLLVMVIIFAESGLLAGFFLPGDSLLFTVGVLVASGVLGLPLWLVVPLLALAAVAGDQTGYLLGRRYGPRVFTRPSSRLLDPRHVDRAHAFFDRHGSKAVVLARFVPVVRTVTPTIAGIARMSRKRFTGFNVIGAVSWTAMLVLGGYFAGGVPFVASHIELIAVAMVALSLLPAAVAWLVGRRRQRGATPSASEREPTPASR